MRNSIIHFKKMVKVITTVMETSINKTKKSSSQKCIKKGREEKGNEG